MNLRKVPAFGFENAKWSSKNKVTNETPEESRAVRNKVKKIAYIPIVGNVIGGVRLYGLCSSNKTRKNFSFHNIERGLIEASGAGILLLPVDLIATLIRNRQAKNQANREEIARLNPPKGAAWNYAGDHFEAEFCENPTFR